MAATLHATTCNIHIAMPSWARDDPRGMDKKRGQRKKQPVSIYTLAEEFSVTPGTVSRALRNRPEIGIATRTSIRKRAEELGFKLRNFETRLTNICVVIETRPKQRSLFSAYVDSVLDGVWRYCSSNEIELSLFVDIGRTRPQRFCQLFHRQRKTTGERPAFESLSR